MLKVLLVWLLIKILKKNGNLQKILRQLLFYELLLIKSLVVALLLYKLIMSALLNDFALLENQNTRSIFNCRHPAHNYCSFFALGNELVKIASSVRVYGT